VAVGIREERRGEEEALIYLIYLSVLHFDWCCLLSAAVSALAVLTVT
jgi:hypothetical protein